MIFFRLKNLEGNCWIRKKEKAKRVHKTVANDDLENNDSRTF